MKNKLSFISIFTLCIALSLTACGGKQSSTTDSKNIRLKPAQKHPANQIPSLLIYISRKISFLQITLMRGTRHLA
jgi:peroxiredoxin